MGKYLTELHGTSHQELLEHHSVLAALPCGHAHTRAAQLLQQEEYYLADTVRALVFHTSQLYKLYRVSANFVAIMNLFLGFDEPPTFVFRFWMCFSRRNSKKQT